MIQRLYQSLRAVGLHTLLLKVAVSVRMWGILWEVELEFLKVAVSVKMWAILWGVELGLDGVLARK
jgi:hypothetical protein